MLEVFCWIVVLYSCEKKTGCQEAYARLDLRLLDPVHQEAVDEDAEGILILVAGISGSCLYVIKFGG